MFQPAKRGEARSSCEGVDHDGRSVDLIASERRASPNETAARRCTSIVEGYPRRFLRALCG